MQKENKNKEFNEIPRGNPFSVPGGYFENFTEQMQKNIKSLEENKTKKITFWKSAKNQLALAAGFLVFVSISYAVMHFVVDGDSSSQPSTSLYADILESEIENYDTYLLMEAYSHSKEEANTEQQLKDEVIDYLINEGIEIEMIINEF